MLVYLLKKYQKGIWLNPEAQDRWEFTPSIKLTNELMEGRMFPLTINGLSEGIKKLRQ